MDNTYDPASEQKPTPAPFAPPARKPLYPVAGADFGFALAIFLETAFGVCVGLWGALHAGFTAAFVPIFATYSAYLLRRGGKPGAFAYVCGAFALALSAVPVFTSGAAVRLVAVCGAAAMSVVWFASIAGRPAPKTELGLATCVARNTAVAAAKAPHSVTSLLRSDDPHMKKASKALLGVACALPVLCIVAALLIRSDAAFEGLMQRIFGEPARIAGQAIVTLCLFPFLLSFGFAVKKEPQTQTTPRANKGLDTLFLAAFLGLLDVCYAAYLFSQLAYFFSAFSGILPEGYSFTYADYARRGFFELCGIAAVNLAALYAMLLLSRKTDGKLPWALCALGTFTGVFTLLLICTAQAKMVLYIRQFGMTVPRLGTSAFMLLMAVTFFALLLRFYLPRVRVLPVAAVTAAVLTLVLGVGNVHAFAARYNYEAYADGRLKTIDTAYLREIGDEGVPYLVLLTKDADPKVRREAYGQLCIAVRERYDGDEKTLSVRKEEALIDYTYLIPKEKIFASPAEWTVPRGRAYAALDKLIEDEPDFTREHAEDAERAWETVWSML